jgi:hypothetical protein
MGSVQNGQNNAYQGLFPTIAKFSNLRNLRYLPDGTPYTGNLSAREVNILFNQQMNAYGSFANMGPSEQIELITKAKKDNPKGNIDIGNYILSPYIDAMRASPFYQKVKEMTGAGSGLTSRQLYQLSVTKTVNGKPLSPVLRLAFKLRADVKRNILQGFKQNFQNIINKMGNDPATDEAEKKREEQDLKTLRAQSGLDEGGGE